MYKFETENILLQTGLFWQYPVKTEEIFYEQNKDNVDFCGIPWATIIDKKCDTNSLFKFLLPFFKHKNYYTCCQHISFRKLIPLMKILGIKEVYTPHKVIGEDFINGVKLLPCPLYAVNIEDPKRNKFFSNIDFENCERTFLYSFMGGVQQDYLSSIRKNIFKMNHPNNTFIKNTGQWHFNNVVYSNKQNKNNDLNIDKRHIDNTEKYNEILLNSRFSLCPSGTGPNSIRFWESIAVGAIPILLADTLELPYGLEWDKAIIRLKEKELTNLPNILGNISIEQEQKMRKNCICIYNKLKNNFKNNIQNTINPDKPVLFTSYLCDINDSIVQNILLKWKKLNPECNILYFSDNDIKNFFKETDYYETYSKMKNGVAIADFFRINYINKYGGFWFDIDIEPFKFNLNHNNNIQLYDCGFGNISYMFIGGKPKQKLFEDTIKIVNENIIQNVINKKKSVLDITGPRVIQNLVFSKLNIQNKDNNFKCVDDDKIFLEGTDYEFKYNKINITSTKTNDYIKLQEKYNKKQYQYYNYI